MTYLFDVVFISVPSYSGNSLKMFLAVPVFKQYFLFSSDSIFLLDTTYDWAFAIWMMTFNKSGIYPVPFQDATCMLSSSSCKALPSVFDLGVGETWLTTEADALFCKQLWNCQSLSTSTVFPLQHKSRVNLSHELNPLLLACDYQSSYECSVFSQECQIYVQKQRAVGHKCSTSIFANFLRQVPTYAYSITPKTQIY